MSLHHLSTQLSGTSTMHIRVHLVQHAYDNQHVYTISPRTCIRNKPSILQTYVYILSGIWETSAAIRKNAPQRNLTRKNRLNFRFQLHKLQGHIKVAHLPGLIHPRDHSMLCHTLWRPLRKRWIPGHADLLLSARLPYVRHGTDVASVPAAIGPADQNRISCGRLRGSLVGCVWNMAISTQNGSELQFWRKWWLTIKFRGARRTLCSDQPW